MSKVRINLANEQELTELPDISRQQVEAIVRFRAEHGPIVSAEALAEVLGGARLSESLRACADFAPAADTAREAPGASAPHRESAAFPLVTAVYSCAVRTMTCGP